MNYNNCVKYNSCVRVYISSYTKDSDLIRKNTSTYKTRF